MSDIKKVLDAPHSKYMFEDLEGWLIRNWLKLPLDVAVTFERQSALFAEWAKVNSCDVPVWVVNQVRLELTKLLGANAIPPILTMRAVIRERYKDYDVAVSRDIMERIMARVPEEVRPYFWNIDESMINADWKQQLLGEDYEIPS